MAHWLVEVVANRVGKSSDGVVEDEKVLGLVLGKRRHQHLNIIYREMVEGGREGGMG